MDLGNIASEIGQGASDQKVSKKSAALGSLENITIKVSQGKEGSQEVADVIEFVESDWGLGVELYPVQRVILKAYYGIPLDDTEKTVQVPVGPTPWRRDAHVEMTEAEYLRYLYSEGRSNIQEVLPEHTRLRELVLSIGRRSGKTFLSACVVAYEVYKLILKGNPQAHYGLKTGSIGIVSVATGKDQAGLLYGEATHHFAGSAVFGPYIANLTQTYATFQTPSDIERFGRYKDDNTAKATIKVTFSSCIAKGLRGPGNMVIILDELAHFNTVGQSDAKTVYEAITPSTGTFSPKERMPDGSLGDSDGRVLSISSPLGKQGYFYELFQMGFKGAKASEDMLCIQAPTWEVNPEIAAQFMEKAYAKNPTSFLTEFGAEFSDRTRGWIDRASDLMACVNPALRPKQQAPPRMPHFMGVDVGLVGNGTAVAIGHIEDGRIITDLVDEIKAGHGKYKDLERLDFDEVADWVYGLSRRFYIVEGFFDQWAGIPFEQALSKRGLSQLLSEHMTKNKNSEIFKNAKDMIWDQRVVLYNWPIEVSNEYSSFIWELLQLQATYHSKYITTVEAPNVEGAFDDRADAWVRMVWCASQHLGIGAYIAKASGANARVTPAARSADRRREFVKSRRMGSSPDRQILRGTRTRARIR